MVAAANHTKISGESGILSMRSCRRLEGIVIRKQWVSRDMGQCRSMEHKLGISQARRRIGAYTFTELGI